MKLDTSKITGAVVVNIHHWDSPDFVDAFIESAEYEGRALTEDELDELNENRDFVHSCVMNTLH